MEHFVVVFLGPRDLWSSARTTTPGAGASTKSGRIGAPSRIVAERVGGPWWCLTRCGSVVGQSEPAHETGQPADDAISTACRELTARLRASHARDLRSVLKMRTIWHALDLWKLARSCKQLHWLCLPDLWNLSGTTLLHGFQSSRGALKSTE